MAKTEIVLTHDETSVDSPGIFTVADTSNKMLLINKLINYLKAARIGIKKVTIKVQDAEAQATGTITAATVVADNTATINGVTFTAKASPSGSVEFGLGASDAEAMDNLATKINAHTTLDGIVTASSNGAGVVTLTAIDPGEGGNAITLASSGATLAVSAARLASGATTTEKIYYFGGAS